MSDQVRVALVGSTGLIGRTVIEMANACENIQLVAISRREMKLPDGVKMEMILADPSEWDEVLKVVQPISLINALGTTWKRAGKDEDAFRAVDYDLVLETARNAVAAGCQRMVTISSVGASLQSKNFYLRVKGEVERDLAKVGMKRLDILRPGLLKGSRKSDFRVGEGLAKVASPLIDPLLRGTNSAYRSIDATVVAAGALELSLRKAAGKFAHDNDGIRRAARDWGNRTG